MNSHLRSKTLSLPAVLVMKWALTYIPPPAIRVLSIYLRNFFRSTLALNNTTSLPITCEVSSDKYHILRLKSDFKLIGDDSAGHAVDDGNMYEDEVIVFIHGGGFLICDCSDFQIAAGVLPCLYEVLGHKPPAIYSLVYSLMPSDKKGYHHAQEDVYNSYIEIVKSGKRVVAVMGGSAGGNLALGLVLRLIDNGVSQSQLPRLVLMCPWLNLFTCDEQDDIGNPDYFESNTLRRAHDLYLGKELSQKLYRSHHEYLNLPSTGRYQTADGWRDFIHKKGDNVLSLIRTSVDGKMGLDLEYVCPCLISDQILNMLPPVLLLIGEDELLYNDAALLSERLQQVNESLIASGKSPKHQYIKGNGEVHMYPTFWTKLLRTITCCLKLEWIYDAVTYFKQFQYIRRDYRKRALESIGKKRHENEWKVAASLHIHSEEAFNSIKKFALFIAEELSNGKPIV